MHTDLEAPLGDLGHRQRVVVVLGVCGVDREDQHLGAIDPLVRDLPHAQLGGLLGRRHHGRREIGREAKAVSDRQDVHSRIRQRTEDLHDRAYRTDPALAVRVEPHHDDVAVRSVTARVAGHEHVLGEATIHGNDVVEAPGAVKGAHDRLSCTVQDLDDPRDRAAATRP